MACTQSTEVKIVAMLWHESAQVNPPHAWLVIQGCSILSLHPPKSWRNAHVSNYRSRVLLSGLIFTALALIQCDRANAADACNAHTVNVQISIDQNGNCTQTGSSNPSPGTGSLAPVLVDHGNCIKFSAKDQDNAAAAFDLKFEQGESPFYEFTATNAGDTSSTGPVQGAPGHTFTYYSVAITRVSTGQQGYCLNGRQLGIIMR